MLPANLNFFILASIILWLLIFVYWIIKSKKQGVLNEIAGLMKLLFSGLILYIPAFVPLQILTYKTILLVQIIGLLIIFLGCIICISAREYLSSNWSGKVIIQEKHNLTKNGPYKIIRHPIYTGVLIMMIGTSIIIGSIINFVWTLFCFLGLYRKSKQEEELLLKEFSETYEQYQKETKMIIPYLL
jgi:protein-S-isoprenylcysteine O-methyltransferase Ste14